MSTPPRWILFDVGNVLITLNPWESMIPGADQAAPHRLHEAAAALRRSGLLAGFEDGQISFETFCDKVRALLGLEVALEELRIHLLRFLGPEKAEMNALIEEIRRLPVRVAAFTNTNEVHLAALNRYAAVRAMEHVIASCEIGCSKPEARAFEKALAILGAKPGDVFFVDDQPVNVEGARSVGMCGVVFEGIARLRRDLADAGVPVR